MKIHLTYYNILTFSFLILVFSCSIQRRPQIKSYKIKPVNIESGDEVTISWRVKKAKYIILKGVNDSLPPVGRVNVFPEETSKFKLEVPTKTRPLRRTIKVKVIGPEIFTFNCPDTANDESIVLFEWKVENADYVRLEPISGDLPIEGNYSAILDSTSTITLKAFNKNGISAEKSHKIKVYQKEYFDGDRVISEGNDALIFWRFNDTEKIKVENVTDTFKSSDALQVRPTKTTKYKISVYRENGKIETKEFKIHVMPAGSFYFSCPKIIRKGDIASMTWDIKGTNEVNVSGSDNVFKGRDHYDFKVNESGKYEISFIYKNELITFYHKIDIVERSFVKSERSISSLPKGMRMDFDIISVDRTNYPKELKLLVAVVDTSGNFITNLSPEYNPAICRKYFKQVIETIEGKKYPINDYTVREIRSIAKPYDITMVMDYSGSMRGTPIKNLERSLRKLIENKYADDRISVVKFDSNINEVIPLTKEKNKLLKEVNFDEFNKYGQSTALFAAGDEGIKSLDTSSNNKMMILFTDGYDNASFPFYKTNSVTAQQLVKNARQNNIKFNIISFGNGTNEVVLEFMAMLSGGKFYNIRNHKHIDEVMNEIPKLTRRYYEVTYTPNIASGLRTIELVYDNNLKTFASTTTKVFTDETYDIETIEKETQKAGNSNPILDTLKNFSNLTPIIEPQVIALFNFNEAIILKNFDSTLLSYYNYLIEHPKSEAILIGHTDSKGTTEACRKLSWDRAEEVKAYFVKKGISRNRIKTVGCGKSHPIWIEEKEEYQSRENRRVEIVILEK